MARKAQAPRLYVLAGVNGAGKSSIGGATIRVSGADYFNPDEAARKLIAANPGLDQTKANAAAWHQGRRLLERAIRERKDFAFETTLGGSTMPRLLTEAAGTSDWPARICTSNASATVCAPAVTTSRSPASGGAGGTAG